MCIASSFNYDMKGRINIMKLMISQPMRGKTNKQIREERAELVSGLQEEGNEVIDTVCYEDVCEIIASSNDFINEIVEQYRRNN